MLFSGYVFIRVGVACAFARVRFACVLQQMLSGKRGLLRKRVSFKFSLLFHASVRLPTSKIELFYSLFIERCQSSAPHRTLCIVWSLQSCTRNREHCWQQFWLQQCAHLIVQTRSGCSLKLSRMNEATRFFGFLRRSFLGCWTRVLCSPCACVVIICVYAWVLHRG